jgi:hypothetical protein
MFKANYQTARFHKDFGPSSLFMRVNFKMKGTQKLYLDGKHFVQRKEERAIPDDILNALCDFDISSWELINAEVRIDRGKFVNSTWEKILNGRRYQVTIGMGNYVTTIVDRTSSGVEKCFREGEFYDYVEQVNKELMEAESKDT